MSDDGAYTAARYGEGCAEFYDDIYPPPAQRALALLATLARGGPLLEAGVGTGRYALPLAERGIAVCGIDASAAMLAALRRKPGAAALQLCRGDFAALALRPRHFRLITCLVDTLALLPRTRQAQALAEFGAALRRDGRLLLETTPGAGHTTMQPLALELHTRRGPRRYSVEHHAVCLDLLDTWAAAAGLRLQARWRDWDCRPWQHDAPLALSLYEKVG